MEALQSKNLDKQDHLISLNSFAIEFVPDLSLRVFGVAINSTHSLPSVVLSEPNTMNNMMRFTKYTVRKLKHFHSTTSCAKETPIIT